ncbi:glycosyl transferase [Empedobacter brevis NBRC 14943 = ATCC 43319]|uniref:Glycosyl transferase n=1 Tax=Empedobacter brevis NBRC 14943 = ATCC 43319 TaxID=1218108 RepID=A0A511NL64_9FLAO|nr:glycosyltransferase family 4 protein [Empedobacter brevis]GEM53437.1 glycosyl transferase [Empedobacter brevis NBRC 14943 = ATCC 43319]
MNVLFIARATLYESPGGDTVQILKTAEELRKLEVNVDIYLANNKEINYDLYDIVHFFNIIRPADILYHFKFSKKSVISTIFVDYEEAEIKSGNFIRSNLTKYLGGDFIEYLKVVARHVLGKEQIISKKYWYWGNYRSIKYLYNNASALLPNSESEKKRLISKYGQTSAFFEKIVNAIEPIEYIESNYKYRDAIICVGRIERRKNQLKLIKAVKNLNIPCYIIGKPAINDLKYYELCKEEAGENTFFIDGMPQREIYQIMKAAKVHVLPSWFETTGLVSLEAYYYRCNIVITKKGDQTEYFKDYAFYCEPDDINSIRKAILEAYSKTFNEEFREYIIAHYTWSETAKQTKKSYERLLQK